MKCLRPIVGAAALIAAGSAHAMEYSSRFVGQEVVIEARGEIEINEAGRFAAFLHGAQPRWGKAKARTIVFDSPGGVMFGGVQMAEIVAHYHLNTGVAHGGECASACVMAWAAGARRSSATDAHIGVHMAREGQNDPRPAGDATLFYANFVKRRGAPASVVAGLVSTPPSDVYWLSLDELRQWNTTLVDASDNLIDRPIATRPPPQVDDWTPAPRPAAVSVVTDNGPPGGRMLPLLLVSLMMMGGSLIFMGRK